MLWVDVGDPDHKPALAIYLTASFGENSAERYHLRLRNAELIRFQGRRLVRAHGSGKSLITNQITVIYFCVHY